MAKRQRDLPILIANLDDCLLGVMYPLPGEKNIPVAVYSADFIAARLRDKENMTLPEARAFVTDMIEQQKAKPGLYRVVWAATVEDFGQQVEG